MKISSEKNDIFNFVLLGTRVPTVYVLNKKIRQIGIPKVYYKSGSSRGWVVTVHRHVILMNSSILFRICIYAFLPPMKPPSSRNTFLKCSGCTKAASRMSQMAKLIRNMSTEEWTLPFLKITIMTERLRIKATTQREIITQTTAGVNSMKLDDVMARAAETHAKMIVVE